MFDPSIVINDFKNILESQALNSWTPNLKTSLHGNMGSCINTTSNSTPWGANFCPDSLDCIFMSFEVMKVIQI